MVCLFLFLVIKLLAILSMYLPRYDWIINSHVCVAENPNFETEGAKWNSA